MAATLLAWAAEGQTPEAQQPGRPAQNGASTYAVVITGLGGDPEYEKIIEDWGRDLRSSLEKSGLGQDRLFWLAAKKLDGVYAQSTQEQIQRLLQTLAGRVQPRDVFQLYLIGHGSYDEYDYRLSLPGPDLTAAQYAELLKPIRSERQLVVNMTSSSGASLNALRQRGRVVITSTSAGQERNFSVFARYFVAALQDAAADADKNEEISALEAYRYAAREVARYYDSQKRLATEHSLMEDRGEGDGVREPAPDNGQGILAAALPVRRLGEQSSTFDTPEVQELRAQKRSVEESIEQLKYNKAGMETDDYFQQLEKLLLQLSQLQQKLDALEKQ
jgi:hypothetical protein